MIAIFSSAASHDIFLDGRHTDEQIEILASLTLPLCHAIAGRRFSTAPAIFSRMSLAFRAFGHACDNWRYFWSPRIIVPITLAAHQVNELNIIGQEDWLSLAIYFRFAAGPTGLPRYWPPLIYADAIAYVCFSLLRYWKPIHEIFQTLRSLERAAMAWRYYFLSRLS